jgi:DNA-binding MarR family transcriptional regulator
MSQSEDNLATAMVAEILAVDQMTRGLLTRGLPKGLELSQFMVLNHLARASSERTPAQLADRFHLTRGAMTNTLSRLEVAGHVHIRPDWDDARRKLVAISPAGRTARDAALAAMTPAISEIVGRVGSDRIKTALSILRELREEMEKG